jgi:hypothetical protein
VADHVLPIAQDRQAGLSAKLADCLVPRLLHRLNYPHILPLRYDAFRILCYAVRGQTLNNLSRLLLMPDFFQPRLRRSPRSQNAAARAGRGRSPAEEFSL